MDEPNVLVVHIKDGKISEAWEFAYNQKAVDDFWA